MAIMYIYIYKYYSHIYIWLYVYCAVYCAYIYTVYIYINDFSFWVCRRKMILLHKSLGFANQQVVAFPLGMDVKGTQDLIIQRDTGSSTPNHQSHG